MKVLELIPGDVFNTPLGVRAIFIARVFPHPIYPNLDLVIWCIFDSKNRLEPKRLYSFDALDSFCDVGDKDPLRVDRQSNLRQALQGGVQI